MGRKVPACAEAVNEGPAPAMPPGRLARAMPVAFETEFSPEKV